MGGVGVYIIYLWNLVILHSAVHWFWMILVYNTDPRTLHCLHVSKWYALALLFLNLPASPTSWARLAISPSHYGCLTLWNCSQNFRSWFEYWIFKSKTHKQKGCHSAQSNRFFGKWKHLHWSSSSRWNIFQDLKEFLINLFLQTHGMAILPDIRCKLQEGDICNIHAIRRHKPVTKPMIQWSIVTCTQHMCLAWNMLTQTPGNAHALMRLRNIQVLQSRSRLMDLMALHDSQSFAQALAIPLFGWLGTGEANYIIGIHKDP